MAVTSSYSLHPLIQDVADVPKFRPVVFKLWFGDPWGGPFMGHLQDQNYFHNNTETFFVLSTLSQVYNTV